MNKGDGNMYKVILVDDERIILEGLSRVVDWKKYGCEVVGTGTSAEEGTQLIRTMKPDILFTDIRMPGQDGLTMLAGLRSEFPNLMVAVLTGYRDIALAQEAMKLGVMRFLLKPSKMDDIHEALTAMTQKLAEIHPEEETDHNENNENNAGMFIVNHAVAYMKEHYAEHLTLQNVADCCYVSQWHLSKVLNRYAEGSFYDLLNSIRIDEAKKMLADPSFRIGDIAERVGYTDTAHFARVFKRIEGLSANEYRNRLK